MLPREITFSCPLLNFRIHAVRNDKNVKIVFGHANHVPMNDL